MAVKHLKGGFLDHRRRSLLTRHGSGQAKSGCFLRFDKHPAIKTILYEFIGNKGIFKGDRTFQGT